MEDKYTYRKLYKQNLNLKNRLRDYKIVSKEMRVNKNFLDEAYSEIFEGKVTSSSFIKNKCLIEID
jgi:hypothetical protein